MWKFKITESIEKSRRTISKRIYFGVNFRVYNQIEFDPNYGVKRFHDCGYTKGACAYFSALIVTHLFLLFANVDFVTGLGFRIWKTQIL